MDLPEKSDKKILSVATPIMNNLMDGSTERNHKKHTRDFTDRAKRIVTKEKLEKQCKESTKRSGVILREKVCGNLSEERLSNGNLETDVHENA